MKKLTALFLSVLMMAVCSACGNNKAQEDFNMDELLKINTYLLSEELEGKGRWGYVNEDEQDKNRSWDEGGGYWIPNKGEAEVANEDVFVFETLELGVPRTMAPMSLQMKQNETSIHYSNLIIAIEFDGLVKITKVDPTDSSIQMRYSLDGRPYVADGVSIQAPCHIDLCPIGEKNSGAGFTISGDTIVGKEYIIQIEACSMDGTPIITAQVKLTAISDPEYQKQKGYDWTRFCEVELISYEYSDMHILKGGI